MNLVNQIILMQLVATIASNYTYLSREGVLKEPDEELIELVADGILDNLTAEEMVGFEFSKKLIDRILERHHEEGS